VAIASRQPDQHWYVYRLISVNNTFKFFSFLLSLSSQPGCILSGFDFPIGLPYKYAEKVKITDFLSALPSFGYKQWNQFFIPAEHHSQIILFRPFYPKKPGDVKRCYIEERLEMPFNHLFRLCESSHKNRRAACPLFWTLGAQQVGKAAIDGWQSLIIPSLIDPTLRFFIWPFSGSLENICQTYNIVVVETYPAEFYGHLGILSDRNRKSKRRQLDRIYYADKLINWSEENHLILDDSLKSMIKDGFGDYPESEDRFDALIGLYGMINVVQGNHPTGEPVPSHIAKIEGWIFGQEQPKENNQLAGTIN
jgi:hypothetical protein